MAVRPPLYHLIDLWISLTRHLHQAGDPEAQEYFGSRTGDMLIRSAVYLSTIEGQPMTAAKLATYVGIPRPTVIRRLRRLERRGIVENRAGVWRTPNALAGRRQRQDFSHIVKLVATAQQRLTKK